MYLFSHLVEKVAHLAIVRGIEVEPTSWKQHPVREVRVGVGEVVANEYKDTSFPLLYCCHGYRGGLAIEGEESLDNTYIDSPIDGIEYGCQLFLSRIRSANIHPHTRYGHSL